MCQYDICPRNEIGVLFAVTWGPMYIYMLILVIYRGNILLPYDSLGSYAMTGIAYLYNCINPFIYATKFDPVKRVLLRLIPCKKTTQPE